MTLGLVLLLLLQNLALPAPPVTPASVDGVVLDSQTGRPLAGVTIVLQTNSSGGRMVGITNADGFFAFRNVPPGLFVLEASRGGYVPERYGAAVDTSALVTPPPQLSPGQVLSVRLALTPGGVISGRLTDDRGDVVVGATVEALRTTYRNGWPERVRVQSAVSNDLGEYRLFMLKPGQYTVAAIPAGVPPTLRPDATPAAIPIYFPETIDPKAAQRIALNVGETIGGVNFLSIPTRNRVVSGAVQANGSDPTGVILSPVNGTTSQQFTVNLDDGQFQFSNVVPGSYLLVARTHDMRAVIPLDVRNVDMLGMRISLGPGFKVPVQVRIEGNPPGEDPELEKLYFEVRPETPVPGLDPETYSPFANGRFTLELLARLYRIEMTRTQEHYVKSMTLEGVDVLNPGLQLASSMEGPLEIVVGKQFGSVEGRAAGRDLTVVLVPDAARRGQRGLFKSVKSNGAFRFQKVPPGDYKLFAWPEATIENGGPYQDAEYLRKYEDRGVPVRIAGDRTTVLDSALNPLLD